jgi:hypothetical protein
MLFVPKNKESMKNRKGFHRDGMHYHALELWWLKYIAGGSNILWWLKYIAGGSNILLSSLH